MSAPPSIRPDIDQIVSYRPTSFVSPNAITRLLLLNTLVEHAHMIVVTLHVAELSDNS